MYLGLDIDGVLGNFVTPLDIRMQEWLGIKVESPLTTWQVEAVTEIQFAFVHDRMISEGDFRRFAVYPHAVKGVELIVLRHSICYITHRYSHIGSEFLDEKVRKDTKFWLKSKGFPEAPIYFEKNKAELCHKLGVGCIIEDRPKQIEELSSVCGVMVMDRPWNQEVTVTRVYDMIHAARLLGVV